MVDPLGNLSRLSFPVENRLCGMAAGIFNPGRQLRQTLVVTPWRCATAPGPVGPYLTQQVRDPVVTATHFRTWIGDPVNPLSLVAIPQDFEWSLVDIRRCWYVGVAPRPPFTGLRLERRHTPLGSSRLVLRLTPLEDAKMLRCRRWCEMVL